jgi:hypothetical protein
MRSTFFAAGTATALAASLAAAQPVWQPYDDGATAQAAAASQPAEPPPPPAPPPAPLPPPSSPQVGERPPEGQDGAAPAPPDASAAPSAADGSAAEPSPADPGAAAGPAAAPNPAAPPAAASASPAALPAPAAPGAPDSGKSSEDSEPCKDGDVKSAEAPTALRSGFSGSPAASELTKPAGPGFSGGAGFGTLSKELYATVLLATSFTFGPVSLGVQAPLRFKIYDLDRNQALFQLRKEDWDEPGDFLRILRFVELNRPKDTVYARFGELTGTTMGHGTIVSSYYNSVDVDHYQSGVRFNLNLAPGGVETMLNDVAGPRLLGARVYARPWHFIDRCSVLCRLAIGASAFVDGAAPRTLDGATLDAAREVHARNKAMGVYGVDAEFSAVSNALLDVTPYTDLNFIGGQGAGWHAGVLVGVHPPVIGGQFRFEFRRLGARYLPGYFDALYEIQRFDYRDGKTKLQYLEDGGSGEAKSGYYGELVVGFGSLLSIMGGYEDYQGPNNSSLQLQVVLPTIAGLKIGAYYVKRNFEGLAEVFDPKGAMGIFEARYSLYPFMAVVAQGARQWRVGADGRFQVVDSFHLGFDFNVQF